MDLEKALRTKATTWPYRSINKVYDRKKEVDTCDLNIVIQFIEQNTTEELGDMEVD